MYCNIFKIINSKNGEVSTMFLLVFSDVIVSQGDIEVALPFHHQQFQQKHIKAHTVTDRGAILLQNWSRHVMYKWTDNPNYAIRFWYLFTLFNIEWNENMQALFSLSGSFAHTNLFLLGGADGSQFRQTVKSQQSCCENKIERSVFVHMFG